MLAPDELFVTKKTMWKLGYTLEEATPKEKKGPKKTQENTVRRMSNTGGLGHTLDEVITILQSPQQKEKNTK